MSIRRWPPILPRGKVLALPPGACLSPPRGGPCLPRRCPPLRTLGYRRRPLRRPPLPLPTSPRCRPPESTRLSPLPPLARHALLLPLPSWMWLRWSIWATAVMAQQRRITSLGLAVLSSPLPPRVPRGVSSQVHQRRFWLHPEPGIDCPQLLQLQEKAYVTKRKLEAIDDEYQTLKDNK
ncbi:hypothetical protein U9M48_041648 [Paspalum notatum var. saurae]|uniref:Uncharacterized protein n=1 Tax=Paspalum notatum var. saurae TaxID=547442 RepID=A0AAQ3UR06_PASNO